MSIFELGFAPVLKIFKIDLPENGFAKIFAKKSKKGILDFALTRNQNNSFQANYLLLPT